jgi:hypothetical protein
MKEFKHIDGKFLTEDGIRKKFDEIWNYVSKKYSLDNEGSNLSAIEEDVPLMEQTVYDMIVEKWKTTSEKESNDRKKNEQNNSMLTIAKGILSRTSANPSFLTPTGSNSGSRTESSSGSGKTIKDPIQICEEKVTSIAEKIHESSLQREAVEKQKLALEERRYEEERANKRRMIELEEKRFELQFQQAQFQMKQAEKQIEIDLLKAQAEKYRLELEMKKMNKES